MVTQHTTIGIYAGLQGRYYWLDWLGTSLPNLQDYMGRSPQPRFLKGLYNGPRQS
jgi:hypothetical protein